MIFFFPCPTCGAPSKVLEARWRTKQRMARDRVCNAGHRFRTYEISKEHFEMMDKRRISIRRKVYVYVRQLQKLVEETEPPR
jgi:hypothetical protein